MSQRKPFVGGNWKMNLHGSEAVALAEKLALALEDGNTCDVAIFPAFPYLKAVADVLAQRNSRIMLGAQDFYFENNGAYTGEVSLTMLKDLGVQCVLVGHSERRHVIGENDVLLNHKVRAALKAGMHVVLCVGEKLDQREQGLTDAINVAQCAYGLAGVSKDQMSNVTIAYEPVWAIGTGKTATPADAQNAHAVIRAAISGWFGTQIGNAVRIQYGGSVKPSNAKELFGQTDIDGGLIGGAALKAEDFVPIVQAAR